MSQQQRRISLPLIGAILLCLLVGVYLVAWKKRDAKPDRSANIIKHPVETNPDDALKYWTKGKMRKAKPVPMPNVNAPDAGKKQPRRPPHSSDPHNS